MKDMIKAMVQEMVAQSIKEVMAEMMGTTPVVANATIEAPKQSTKMSVEELLSLEAEEDEKAYAKHNANLQPLGFEVVDFKPRNGKKYRKALKYNKYISNKAVWTYNHLQIKAKYPAIKYSEGHYYADTLSDLQAFASQFHIVEQLTDKQMLEVKAYWAAKRIKSNPVKFEGCDTCTSPGTCADCPREHEKN